jgi:hypothetical protein
MRVQRSARKLGSLYLKVGEKCRFLMMVIPVRKDLKGSILSSSKGRRKRMTRLTTPTKKRIKVKKKKRIRRLSNNKRRIRYRYRRMQILSKIHLQSSAST